MIFTGNLPCNGQIHGCKQYMQSFAQTYNPICINRKVLLDAFRYFCSRINKKPGYGLRISSYFYYLWLKIEIILMNKPQITIKDIARALNVSPSTVSRALKDNPDISRETRDLIHAYAREHNYKPNVLAVNLRSSRSNTIGVIVPQLVHHFFSCVLSGIETAAAKAGYNIIVAQSNESYEQEVKIVHSFLAARVCGVIASLAKNTEQYDHYQELLNNDIPIVFYDRICTELKTERVVVDDYAGSFAAVEYMIQTGCKRIFFYGASPHLEITKNRRNGYLDAMKKYKVPVDDSMIKLCDNRERAIAITPDLL